MKKTVAIFLALIMLLSIFAACGKKDSGETTTADSGNKPASSSGEKTNTPSGTDSSAPSSASSSTQITGDVSLADQSSITLNPSDDTLNYAFHSVCSSLIPIGGPDDGALYPDQLFYETLVAWDSVTGKLIPKLATEWEWKDDLTLRMKIREGVTSIAGDPFTAKDVLFTITFQYNNAAIKNFFGSVDLENCKVIDDYTIDVVMQIPYPQLPLEMVSASWSMIVEKSFNDIGGYEACKDNEGAGTGPYKCTAWDPTGSIKAERREDYWGNTPYYKYINVTSVTDASTRAFGIEAGDYDLVSNTTYTQCEAALNNKNMAVWSAQAPAYCYSINYNTGKEPMNNADVRRALTMAVDTETIIKIALCGFGTYSESATLCPRYNELYTEVSDESKNYIKFDLEAAKEMLIKAGYPDGFTIEGKYRSGDSLGQKIAELLVNMLAKINVTLELMPREGATYTAEVRSGDFDMIWAIAANPSPNRFLNPLRPSSGYAGGTGWCGSGWYEEAPELGEAYITELIDNCSMTVDNEKRLGYWKELNDVVREYVPKFILFDLWTVALTAPDVEGMYLDSYGNPYLWSVYGEGYFG